MEAIYAFTHFLAPVLPLAAQTIFEKIGVAPVSAHNLRDDMYNLAPGTPVSLGEILFQKIEVAVPDAAVAVTVASAAAGALDAKAGAGKPKAASAKSSQAAAAAAVEEEALHEVDFSKLELRVGRVQRAWHHETADRLYCEEIDVGAEAGGVRVVVSGLRGHYTMEELQGRLVAVVCNLKESKFQGVMSFGMVLAAKGTAVGGAVGKVELLQVPEGSAVGERLTLQGFAGAFPAALSSARTKKLKVWEAVVPDLHTDDSGAACWKELQLCTSAGICRVDTLVSSPIS